MLSERLLDMFGDLDTPGAISTVGVWDFLDRCGNLGCRLGFRFWGW